MPSQLKTIQNNKLFKGPRCIAVLPNNLLYN